MNQEKQRHESGKRKGKRQDKDKSQERQRSPSQENLNERLESGTTYKPGKDRESEKIVGKHIA